MLEQFYFRSITNAKKSLVKELNSKYINSVFPRSMITHKTILDRDWFSGAPTFQGTRNRRVIT